MSANNKPSLVKAVTEVLNIEFVGNRVAFSAHDVTSRLRELISQQSAIGAAFPIDVAETGTVYVQGRQVARIAHEDVREIVHSLFADGMVSNYIQEMNGEYVEYKPDDTAVPDPAVSTVTVDPLPIGTSTGPWSVI